MSFRKFGAPEEQKVEVDDQDRENLRKQASTEFSERDRELLREESSDSPTE